MLPTPAKCHYLFNLRDVWRVFLGVCSLKSRTSSAKPVVVRCFLHEIDGVFGDRLIDTSDREWLRTQQKDMVGKEFKLEWDELISPDMLVFGSLMTQDVDSRVYQEIPSSKEMKEAIESYLEEYNETHPHAMHLSMFLDACGHVARICRVLEQPNGNCLLLGVGGSGRQSLSRLATHIEEFELYQIEVVKGYGMAEFREDLKQCLMKCGVDNKIEVFLFCDTQIVNEQFVECVNNILNSGDVPNLYKTEDLDAITTVGRGLCTGEPQVRTRAHWPF